MKDKKTTIFDFLLFFILFTVTYLIIFDNQNPITFVNNFRRLDISYVIIGFIVMFFYFVIEGINIKILLKSFNEKISLLRGIKYTMIGFFFSAITPAASGGQPMEIYYMSKDGIKVSHATVSLLIHLCGYQISVVFLGIMCALLNPELFDTKLTILFIVGTFLNCLSLTAILIGLFSKKISKKLIKLVNKIIRFLRIKRADEINNKINEEYEMYQECSQYITKHNKEFIAALFRAFLQVVCMNSIIYFTYKSFGFTTYSYFSLIQVQAILNCSVTSIPLPGAVGISESVFIMIYELIFSSYLTNALLVNRTISFYAYVLICLIVVTVNKVIINRKNKKAITQE